MNIQKDWKAKLESAYSFMLKILKEQCDKSFRPLKALWFFAFKSEIETKAKT